MANQPEEEGVTLTLPEALDLAIQAHRGGVLHDAETLYKAILDLAPDYPDALHYYGMLCHQFGREEQALELLDRAAELAPEYPDLFNNLGNILKEQGRYQQAEAAYRRVIELRPGDADAHNNLGVTLRHLNREQEARETLAKALELNPDHGHAHYNMAHLYYRQRRFDEAAGHYRRAIELQTGRGAAYHNLGLSLYRDGQFQRAAAVYREWLELEPGNPLACHMNAALSGENIPPRASDDFVRQTFDHFSSTFDERLAGLEYSAPQQVAGALAARVDPGRELVLLDAGCGTGLCGPLLRPFARELVGVDLSGKMLAKARGRGVYDRLEEAELTAFIAADPARWDAIVSADTLCYFGALEEVIAAAASALRPGGLLIFTVERAEEDDIPEG
ncbi:MAG: tetratricopeptide repeat protein, partial [Candidatus Competibacteraceae bacterium]|nr:tetratricopeptide repeat protein [Candidatus Competibacteraceae bacterium]